jgi:membrane-associated phospholipid phosphatase
LVDTATQAYLASVAVLILAGQRYNVTGWGWWLGLHLILMAFVHALVAWAGGTSRLSRGIGFLRETYPVLLYPILYRATGALNQLFHRGYLDAAFRRVDATVFGFEPGFELMTKWPHPAVSELFHAAYFSYYVMIVGVGAALYVRDRPAFRHFVGVVSFVFYFCYLTYVFLPVVGPRVYYPELVPEGIPAVAGEGAAPEFPAALQTGPFFRLMSVIYDRFEAPGAAFPSSHVAIALVTVFFSFRYLRPIRWVHLGVAILLCVATVYCRYHYAVDVLAGGAVAALLLPLGNRLHWRGERPYRTGGDGRE